MKGVAARYPAIVGGKLQPRSAHQCCRTEQQPALAYESRDLLALTAYVARQSSGHADRRR